MTDAKPSRWRALWVLPPLALGIAFLIFMAGSRQPPAQSSHAETRQPVRVVEALRVDLVPTAEGYGEARPARVWAAVAQVAGRVVETHPQLRDGEIISEGEVLFRIDPVDFELRVAQAQAELAELDVQQRNSQASLAIDQRNLRLAERERSRIARLAEQGTVSTSEVDNAERAVLNARSAVQNTENTLALLPTRRRLLQARLEQAGRDLDNTVVRAPFTLRVTDLAIEKDQYVGVGQTLFRGDGTDRVEIIAQMAMSSLRRLFLGREQPVPTTAMLQNDLPAVTGFRPLVRMDLGGQQAEWQAEFLRFSDRVDPQTRSIGVVVAVDRPLAKAIPGQRPPLSKGMFVQVLIRGHTQPGRIVVPRSAIRADSLYLVDADSRLQIRPVTPLFSQGPLSVIAKGVDAGEQIVVSDLVPAVEGMLLDPRPDQRLLDEIRAAAGGAP